MRGQFIRGDGLVIPNTVSIAGARMLLDAALKNIVPTFYMGLVKGVPTPGMTLGDMQEPTIGVHGYARKAIARSVAGWTTSGYVGNEAFLATDFLDFTPVGGVYDKSIQRCMLLPSTSVDPTTPVYSLSAALPAEVILDPAMDHGLLIFQYQLFL